MSFAEDQRKVEATRSRQFKRQSALRIARGRKAGKTPDDLKALERRYYAQHRDESNRRKSEARNMDNVKKTSQRGGYWELGNRKEHTADCLFMAGKNWSWKTLGVVNPANRHPGCGCTIKPWRADKPDGDSLTKGKVWMKDMKEGRAGGSMGGQDPRKYGKIRYIVRSFGTWANGKHSVCTKRLRVEHPELCKGDCNALCAWLKDQWAGTTKWRKGRGGGNSRIKASLPPLDDRALDLLYEYSKKVGPDLSVVLLEALDDAEQRGPIPRDMALLEYDAKAGILGQSEMLELLARLDAEWLPTSA